MAQLAAQVTFILPPPAGLSTVGGYVEWRAFGGLAILFGVWARVSGSGATRGDEERGLVEAVLASGVTRSRWLASRVIGYAAMALIAALAGGLGLVAGVAVGGESINLGPVVRVFVALAALGLPSYSPTGLIRQVVGARVATAAAGVVLLALFLVNRLSQTFTWLAAWRWISPFHYYELNQPLAPGGAFDARATLTMLGIATVGAAVAAVAFEWRDLGAPLVRWPLRRSPAGYEASGSPLWRGPGGGRPHPPCARPPRRAR